MLFWIHNGDLDAFRHIGRAAEAFGDADLNGLIYRQSSVLECDGGRGSQKTLDFTIFIPGPQERGHAAGGGGFRNVGKAINTPENTDPLPIFDVIQVDTIGISDFDGLRRREATVLTLGQFPKFLSQFF